VSYKDLGDGTVRDEVTCLVWQKAVPTTTYTWADAKSYCTSLSLAGTGWRLPTRMELITLVSPGGTGNPLLNKTAFPSTPPKFYWTSSPWFVAHTPPYAWQINFFEGLVTNAGDQTLKQSVRCVRTSSPASTVKPTYVISTTGEVKDTSTGLIWQRATSATQVASSAAAGICSALTLNGRKWRLPSIHELSSLVDEFRVAPAINITAFPDTSKNQWYWSLSPGITTTSPYPTNAATPFGINYDDGFTNFRTTTVKQGFVRCVAV